MNRAFFIILVPAVAVVVGYVVVFRAMRMTLPWVQLLVPAMLLGGALWWVGRGKARRAGSNAR